MEFVANNPNFKLLNAIEHLDISFSIDEHSNAAVSKFLTIVFENADDCSKLTGLTFRKGIYNCDFSLPDSCSKLKTLRIGMIKEATFTLPNSCMNLETLDIGWISNEGRFIAPFFRIGAIRQ